MHPTPLLLLCAALAVGLPRCGSSDSAAAGSSRSLPLECTQAMEQAAQAWTRVIAESEAGSETARDAMCAPDQWKGDPSAACHEQFALIVETANPGLEGARLCLAGLESGDPLVIQAPECEPREFPGVLKVGEGAIGAEPAPSAEAAELARDAVLARCFSLLVPPSPAAGG